MTPSPTTHEERGARTYGAYLAMSLIWGSTFLAIRIGNEAVPPIWSAILRLSLATVLYTAIALLTRTPHPRGPALRAAVVYGFLNYGVNFVLLYWGELTVPSGTSAILYATIPLTTAVAAAMLRVHPLQKNEVLGAVIGLAGVVFVFSGELSKGGPPLALAAVFIAAIAGALAGVALKMGPPQSTWAANGIGAAVGLVVCIPCSLALGESWAMPRGMAGWGPILYLVLAGNLGAYALYGWLLTKWKVTTVNSITLIIPVVAVILGALVRSEALTAGAIGGAALVMAGVAITLFTKRR